MKNIELYISELVDNHDCVIVPGLGAFIAQPTSADIHPITHKFTAPGRTLGFNAQIKVNDGLLASEISVREGISFQEANAFIEEFVKKIATSLSLYKHYNFTGIGRFFYNLEGKLEFEPDYLANFSSDSFGLTDFVFKPIDRNTYDMNQNTHRKAKEVVSKSNKEEETSTTKSNTLAKVLFVLMPLVVLIGAAGYVVYNQQKDISLGGINVFETLGLKNTVTVTDTTSNTSEVVDSLATIADATTVEEVVETPAEVIPEEVTVMEEVSVPVKEEVPASKKVATGNTEAGKYYIIVGSFKNENNADNLHEKLVKNGKEVTKLPVDANGYYKVAVGAFETIDAANSEVTSLSADFSGIWVKKY